MQRLLVLLIAALLATACGLRQERAADPADDTLRPAGPSAERTFVEGAVLFEEDEEEFDPARTFLESEIYPGSGVFIDEGRARRREPEPVGEGEITLNFEGQGIQEVVHAILGHMLQENYVIAPGVSGEVTFATARPISRNQVLPILETLLRWNNATLIWREDRYHVLPVSDAVRGHLIPRMGNPAQQRGYEVIAVPLRYIAPTKMLELLEPYIREDAVVAADNARALLFLAGTPGELRNYLHIVETFDVDWLEGMSVALFALERVEVSEVAGELEALFGEGAETPLAGMFRFLPLERLNAVMVITTNEHYLHEAEKWIKRLDRSSPEAGSRLYVYRVKNLEADVLAGYLVDLFGTGQARPRPRERRGALAPGLEEARVTTVGEFQRTRGEREETRAPRTDDGPLTLGDDGDVRITAVAETNSLLIQASPSQYDAIHAAIRRLDEEPLQVLIEAQIIEVALNDALRYGVNWFLANSQPTDEAFPGLPDGFSPSRAADRARLGEGGFFTTITRRSLDRTFVTATIDALESISDVRTLSTPSLLVRNNAEARINVGRQIPIVSQTVTGVTDRVFGTTQFLNTGVILEVTPRVNPGGLVYLRVRQEVSSPDAGFIEEGRNPPIANREVTSEVAVQSGGTVVLGGLIQETSRNDKRGVPGLRRIPVLGSLFGTTDRSTDRSETLVLITPTVLESTTQLEEVSREFERKFRGLRPLRDGIP